jgi:hypothetical protein
MKTIILSGLGTATPPLYAAQTEAASCECNCSAQMWNADISTLKKWCKAAKGLK